MLILNDAKVISRAFCVVAALCLLPLPAHAGVELQSTGDLPEFEIHFRMTDEIVGVSDQVSGNPDSMMSDASAFSMVPVGTVDDLQWGLFNTGLGNGGWETVDAPTEIPEPAPLAILGIAILALGFYRSRRTT